MQIDCPSAKTRVPKDCSGSPQGPSPSPTLVWFGSFQFKMKQRFLEFSASHHALARYPALLNPNLQPIRIQGVARGKLVSVVHPGAQAESHRVLDPYFDLILRDGITVFKSTVRCGIEELSVCRKDAGKVSMQEKSWLIHAVPLK